MGKILDHIIGGVVGLTLVCSVDLVQAAENPPTKPFATVGDVVLDAQAFSEAARLTMRQKYYHGSIPVEQREAFLREVGKGLVDRVLLLKEAKRRNIVVDQADVDKQVAEYDLKQATDPKWVEGRETLMPLMAQQLQEQNLLKQLEAQVRNLPEVDIGAVEAYYTTNPDKFTQPMDLKVSVILLPVDPSAGGDAWKKSHDKAEELIKQLKAGADFAEMARSHSGDASAQNGGKMDYSHKGMLAPEAEKGLEKVPVKGIVGPLMVLEGVAIFRLDDSIPPKLVPFQEVQKRARALLMREMADQAWDTLKKRLREQTTVSINEEYYLPLSPSGPESPLPNAGQSAPAGVGSP